MNIKNCPVCKEDKPLIPELWPRNSGKPGGFNYCCKLCHRKNQQTKKQIDNRKKLDADRYRKETYKHRARQLAREEYVGSYKCAVLNCEETKIQLHHIDYTLPLDVIPVCPRHHDIIHSQ